MKKAPNTKKPKEKPFTFLERSGIIKGLSVKSTNQHEPSIFISATPEEFAAMRKDGLRFRLVRLEPKDFKACLRNGRFEKRGLTMEVQEGGLLKLVHWPSQNAKIEREYSVSDMQRVLADVESQRVIREVELESCRDESGAFFVPAVANFMNAWRAAQKAGKADAFADDFRTFATDWTAQHAPPPKPRKPKRKSDGVGATIADGMKAKEDGKKKARKKKARKKPQPEAVVDSTPTLNAKQLRLWVSRLMSDGGKVEDLPAEHVDQIVDAARTQGWKHPTLDAPADLTEADEGDREVVQAEIAEEVMEALDDDLVLETPEEAAEEASPSPQSDKDQPSEDPPTASEDIAVH